MLRGQGERGNAQEGGGRMSEPIRYLWIGQMAEDPQGTLVSFADYASLWAKLETITAERDAFIQGGVTEELLRKHDGYIKVGRGCALVREDDYQTMRAELEADEQLLDAIFLAADGLPQDGEKKRAARVYLTLPEQITKLQAKLAEAEEENLRLEKHVEALKVNASNDYIQIQEQGKQLAETHAHLEAQRTETYQAVKRQHYAEQMIVTQESMMENLRREAKRYKDLLEGKP